MPRVYPYLFALILCCAGWPPAEPAWAESERPDFTGTWQLDEELSDDPREKMREAARNRGRGGQGRGGFGGPGGGRGGFGGAGGQRPGAGQSGDRSEGRAEARGGMLRQMQEGAAELRIEHSEPTFTVTDASDRTITVDIDGEAVDTVTPEGTVLSVEADWKRGNRMRIERTRDEEGPTMTETYELIAEGQRLYVTLKIEGGDRRPDLEFRRVYERVEAAAIDDRAGTELEAPSDDGSGLTP